MSNLENASLILKGYDLTSTENNFGVCNSLNTSFTWKNINLRTVLGNMYDKYDTFNICLNTICCSTPPANLGVSYGNSDINNLHVIINISGLPFINQTYSQSNNRNTSSTPIGAFTFPTATTQVGLQSFYSSNVATFGKSQELCNITISYSKVLDGLSPTSNLAFPEPVFIFDIIGIDKERGNLNGSRLDR